jgi:hypothetical protein
MDDSCHGANVKSSNVAHSDKCRPKLFLNNRIAGSVIKGKLERFFKYRRSGIAHIDSFKIIYNLHMQWI